MNKNSVVILKQTKKVFNLRSNIWSFETKKVNQRETYGETKSRSAKNKGVSGAKDTQSV